MPLDYKDLPSYDPGVELHPELMSLYGLNPLIRHISSSRAAMFTGNLSAMVAIKEPTQPRLKTLMERPFGKATCNISFKDDVEIIEVIPRFAHTAGANRIRHSPQTLVVYENYRTKEIGATVITDYHCTHQHFGVELKRDRDVFDRLRRGATFPKGTRIAGSPLVDEYGNYSIGRETNLLMASDLAGTEDGVKVRRGYLEKLAPTGFEKRVFEFGREFYPINQSTVPGTYKVFPDIGEKVASSGLLVALRRYDPISAVSNMTTEALLNPDYIFDRRRFCHHVDAEVIDIRVERNTSINIPPVPIGMEEQLFKYYNADTEYYRRIVELEQELRRRYDRRGVRLNLEPEFHRIVVEAYGRLVSEGMLNNSAYSSSMAAELRNSRVDKVCRGVKLDAWWVEITFKYLSVPNRGYKVTDLNGNKSVVVEVVDDEDMPCDENGVVADMVVDPNSRWNRETPASPIGMMIGAVGRDLAKRIQARFGFDMNAQLSHDQARDAVYSPENGPIVTQAFEELMDFYAIIAPVQWEALNSEEYRSKNPEYMYDHVIHVLEDHQYGLHLAMPADNPVDIPKAIKALTDRWPPFKTTLRFRGRDGKMKTTKTPMLIAPSYYITLEKTAEDSWMASSSSPRNVFGTTSRLTGSEKYDSPGRESSIRVGESEIRLEAATCTGEAVAEQKDASNNPVAHSFMQRKILTAERPTDIEEALDRSVVPVGGHRPLAYLRHMFECSGKELTNE